MATKPLHRQKRPFQPSITSYFGRADRDEYEPSRAPTAAATQQPVLEASVQSDLLSVGMRIRKAVPEGYKTHKTALFYDTTPAVSNSSTYTPMQPRRPAELLPFCGLHKVGGHGIQDLSLPVNPHEPIDIFADNRMPLSLSQESSSTTTSTLSTDSMPAAPMLNPLTKNKRRHYDEDEDIPPFELHFSNPLNPLLADLSVSPTNTTFSTSRAAMPDLQAMSRRAMAKPKSRRKASVPLAVVENVPAAAADAMDFEDAEFLKPWQDEVMMMMMEGI